MQTSTVDVDGIVGVLDPLGMEKRLLKVPGVSKAEVSFNSSTAPSRSTKRGRTWKQSERPSGNADSTLQRSRSCAGDNSLDNSPAQLLRLPEWTQNATSPKPLRSS
jgi:hypothetical protein